MKEASPQRLHILLPTDVFPPRSGGAGWSAHALALALIERGHSVTALVPQRGGHGPSCERVLGVPVLRWGYRAPRIPFVQNYFRHERLWPTLSDVIVKEMSDAPAQSAIIHAQHVQTAPPAVMAGRRLGAPVVVTVRDHWPWDYFATGLHADRLPYARQTWASLAADLPARLGPLRGALALPAIPYMLAHLRRRQRFLGQADAVIAVSDYIARHLAGLVAPERLHIIPNMVDLAAIDATIASPPASVAPGRPYLLYVGKLDRNKGAHLLVDIFRELKHQLAENQEPQNDRTTGPTLHHEEAHGIQYAIRSTQQSRQFSILNSQFSIPELMIAGSGPLQLELARELAALGVRARFLDWVDHDEVLRLMAGCTLLLFPSAWGEPLSRVPLEGMACGAPILAMPTGGTPSIIVDGATGALEPTIEGFARRMAALLAQPEQRAALGAAGRQAARQRYAKEVVVGQVEQLYLSLCSAARRAGR